MASSRQIGLGALLLTLSTCSCTLNDEGFCALEGFGACSDGCDDDKSCTIDRCNEEEGSCEYEVGLGLCLIDGQCWTAAQRANDDLCLACIPGNSQTAWTEVCRSRWIETAFEDFLDGELADGGVNLYVAAAGNIQRIERNDIDDDGFVDLVMTNGYDGASHQLDSHVYWGAGDRALSDTNRTALPGRGATQAAVADLNDDWYADIVLCNQVDTGAYYINSFIYWGSAHGFRPESRTELPTIGCHGSTVADLNRDGYLDIVFANLFDGTTYVLPSYIYWGAPSGFDVGARTELPTNGGNTVSVADLNSDGFLDILFSNYYDGASYSTASYVYWGAADGFHAEARQELLTHGGAGNSIADLNGDGHLDVLFANYYGLSSIYWGSTDGLGVVPPTELPTLGANDVSAADLDGDGYLDIVYANYFDGWTRHLPSYIYWGGAVGFAVAARVDVPTVGALGNLILDFDGDGLLDIFFSCHHNNTTYVTPSRLYWGSLLGYTPTRRLDIGGMGSHFSTNRDPGNVHDRGPREIYVSSAHDAGAPSDFSRISWNAVVPEGTSLVFQLRSAPDRAGLDSAAWRGPTGPDDGYLTSPSALGPAHNGEQWIQYRAIFESPSHGRTPRLDEVQIDYTEPAL